VYHQVLTEGVLADGLVSESAVSELLEVLRTGDAADLIRESVRMVFQELIETEARDVIGGRRPARQTSGGNLDHRQRRLSAVLLAEAVLRLLVMAAGCSGRARCARGPALGRVPPLESRART
jgi:hypothetical protein